jgi:trehalose/maltose hydrolase-like predicted phosphorylase
VLLARGGRASSKAPLREGSLGVIGHPAFPVETWTVTETAFSPEVLAQSETIFTVANGYLGLRGNLDEPTPSTSPAPT